MIKQVTTNLDRMESYVDDVASGRRCAGKLERDMVQRHLDDLDRVGDPDFPYVFDTRRAEQACEFFSLLRHSDGEYAGQPFTLYGWQCFITASLHGWRHKDTGYRRFRQGYIQVGRGNGKTPFGAGQMLLVMGFDDPFEPRAECYTAAVKRDQAKLSFDAAKRFVDSSGLEKSGYMQLYKQAITLDRVGSKLEPLSSDAKSADGLNIHGLLKDELHAWTHYQRDFLEKLQTALGKRRQPLDLTITTAGDEQSVLWLEEYALCRKVVERETAFNVDSLFVAIYEIDDDDDELDEAVWGKANPMLEHGVVKINYLRDLASKARENETLRSQFRRYHANKLTTSANKSFRAEHWSVGDSAIPWGELKDGFAGVDLGWKDDLAAIGYCFPLDSVKVDGKSKRRYAVFADVFCPRGGRRKLDRPPFADWAKSGRLVVTESEWTDTDAMYDALERRMRDHGISTLAYDPNNFREFATNVVNRYGIEAYAFYQKHAKYHEPFNEFKIALSEGRIIHGGDSLLAWSALNVVEEEKGGYRMPAKDRSEDKIDPFVAVLMAFSEAMFAERKKRSVYEERGPLLFG